MRLSLPQIHFPNLHLPANLHLPEIAFLSPEYLWLLLGLPMAAALYFILLRRRKKAAVQYGNFGMLKRAVGAGGRFRRHIPPALFLVALALMIVGIARPTAVMSVASHKSTVILVLDVSGSMRATDVKPSRIEAMQASAKAFIAKQPKSTLIGIVAFAGSAFLVQPQTADRISLNAAIDRLELQRRTAVGSGILTALAALFPDEDFGVSPFEGGNPFEAGSNYFHTPYSGLGDQRELGKPAKKKPAAVEPGSDKSAVIILLTDGATNAGPDPIEAARQAANHGVRVYTVGFGTPTGGTVGFGGRRMHAELDEESLKRTADITRAQYFRAGSAEDLQAVYRVLSNSLVVETKQTEITSLFAAAAALVALLSAGLSVLWFGRVL
jgi:Ca-activated chloride channel family protein